MEYAQDKKNGLLTYLNRMDLKRIICEKTKKNNSKSYTLFDSIYTTFLK